MHFLPIRSCTSPHVTSCPPICVSPHHTDIYHCKTIAKHPIFFGSFSVLINKCSRSARCVHQGSGDSGFGMRFQCPIEGLVQFVRLVAVDLSPLLLVLCIIIKQILKHEENCHRPTLNYRAWIRQAFNPL